MAETGATFERNPETRVLLRLDRLLNTLPLEAQRRLLRYFGERVGLVVQDGETVPEGR